MIDLIVAINHKSFDVGLDCKCIIVFDLLKNFDAFVIASIFLSSDIFSFKMSSSSDSSSGTVDEVVVDGFVMCYGA